MEKHKLELKKEVKAAGQDVVIFVTKQRGRRLKFPIDTPVEEYPKFKSLGFNIFRCSECKSEACSGTCDGQNINHKIKEKYTSPEEKAEKALEEQYNDTSSIDELAKGLDIYNEQTEEELDAIINGTSNHKEEVKQVDVIDYEKYTLKELRKMFPQIKDTSKKGFISQIK